ncbi:MAG: 16S rRNA (cytidine(1402)-2'-O)-methyltransferase [Elusimicrobiota bacterium]|jgi:16S rRNA (cytidine1402-2'-O)-methyltransferase|nr:16S rRNA (cytidine(1402)-2'-O)-methyltransferase [Elusimicrobiota bacterium]
MLCIVPTPIGNLQDITLRALDALKTADFIFCEDTRQTSKLAAQYALKAKLIRYNEHSEISLSRCVALLKEGRNCALVCDAGTPCISDPGWKLVKEARANDIEVVVLPGPSALTCALSGAGVGGGAFSFIGFPPKKQGKIVKILSAAFALEKPIVVYESPYRVVKFIEIIKENFDKDIRVTVARELTKTFEEWISGTAGEILENLKNRKKILGEFVIVLNHLSEEKNETESEDF